MPVHVMFVVYGGLWVSFDNKSAAFRELVLEKACIHSFHAVDVVINGTHARTLRT